MKDLKLAEILRLNRELDGQHSGPTYSIRILSNIVLSPIKEILEFTLRSQGVHATVAYGAYDNVLQESLSPNHANLTVIFLELANLAGGLYYNANTRSDKQVEELIRGLKSELSAILEAHKGSPLVLINRFSTLAFNYPFLRTDKFDRICAELNEHLARELPPNFILIDIDKIIGKISIKEAIDYRMFRMSMALYTVRFLREYSSFIAPAVLSVCGLSKKALVVDCDNTLWKGLLGEDGPDKIEMSDRTAAGRAFREAQHLILNLSNNGALLCIASRNNESDVLNVLSSHEDMTLKEKNFAAHKINWESKDANIQAIQTFLNIGLNSLVLLDDSPFECEAVRRILPEVLTIQAPADAHEYPQVFREHSNLFFNLSSAEEDSRKTEMLRTEAIRRNEGSKYSSLTDFLKSLDLRLTISINRQAIVQRIAQLTQKTNQFNLITRRYTESQIAGLMKDGARVYGCDLRDRLGEYGTVGVVIVTRSGDEASIDTLLMSCRALGRQVEFAFVDYVIEDLGGAGVRTLLASWFRSAKNSQVADFYDRIGFSVVSRTDDHTTYSLNLSDYQSRKCDFIEVRGD
jgi:FkbH-like protein